MIGNKLRINNKSIKLFILFFMLYAFLGMCLSYSVNYEINIFFGADNTRAFLDLTDISYNHYRIKVHPLFLIITQPIVLILDGIVNNPGLSVIIIESAVGALSVVLIWKILELLSIDDKIRHIISLIYGFSFSLMIFSGIPETFIFSGLGLIFYWYFVYKAANCNKKSRYIDILFVITGIISFGMTLTNYIPYCVGLIYYLVIHEQRIKRIVNRFVVLNIINAASVIILCVVQKMTWSQCPIFLESIIDALLGLGYEETSYMNWGINVDKTINWFKEIFMHSVISPDVYLKYDTDCRTILFSGYSIVAKIAIVMFFIIVIFALTKCFKVLVKDNERIRKYYVVALGTTLIWNIVLHYIYGAYEAFMYTPHFIYILFILIAIGINGIVSGRVKKLVYCVLVVFCLYELINNIFYGLRIAELALGLYGLLIPWFKVIVGTLILSLICYIICWGIEKYSHAFIGWMNRKDEYDVYKTVCNAFVLFGVIVLLCCIFVSFNYDGVSGTINYFWNILIKLKMKLFS